MLSLFCLAVRLDKGVVSKETVVLRRWGSSILKAFRISVRWPIYIINSVDKTKFLLDWIVNQVKVAHYATFPNQFLS